MKQSLKKFQYFLLFTIVFMISSYAFTQDHEASSAVELDGVNLEETTPNEMTVREFNFNATDSILSLPLPLLRALF